MGFFHWLKYDIRIPGRSLPAIDPQAKRWLTELKREGIVALRPPEAVSVARHLQQHYFSSWDNVASTVLRSPSFFIHDINREEFQRYGTTLSCEISMKDPGLSPLLLSSWVSGLLFHYYGRQPYLRNQPVLQEIDFASVPRVKRQEAYALHGNTFHSDWRGQVSFMLLLTDTTAEDTHMEYLRRSHQDPSAFPWHTPRLRTSVPQSVIDEYSESDVFSCVGKAGTLFIFDAGGLHRRRLLAGKPRRMWHCNFTTGHHLQPFCEVKHPWPQLTGQAEHVQNLFRYVKKLSPAPQTRPRRAEDVYRLSERRSRHKGVAHRHERQSHDNANPFKID